MRWLQAGAQFLQAEARIVARSLLDRWFLAALGLFAALLLLAAQLQFHSIISVGLEEGYGSDRPMLAGFHDPEISEFAQTRFRWTTERSLIQLSGVGGRPLLLTIRLLAVDPSLAAQAPSSIEIWSNGTLLATAPIRPEAGETLSVLLPADTSIRADQIVELRSATFTPAGDRRAIGLPITQITATSVGALAWPAWPALLSWLGAAALLWLALCRIELPRTTALALLLAATALASLAAVLDPPRFAFGATTALTATALGWAFALLLQAMPRKVLFPLGAQPAARRWLMLFAVVVLVTHYGGKIYPDAMWGDIGFHSNRFQEVTQGRVLLLSRNRGVDFPYPPALYLLLAPFALAGISDQILLQLSGALLNAFSPFVIYAIAVGGMRPLVRSLSAGRLSNLAVTAAGIYALAPATLMTTWWNFSTHIFTQFVHLLLIAAIILIWSRTKPKEQAPHKPGLSAFSWEWLVLFVLQSQVFLGHFGFWMNMSLLSAGALLVLLVAAWRDHARWKVFWWFTGVFVAAETFAVALFYSSYTGLFLDQARAAAEGGLTNVQGKPAEAWSALWAALWDAGLRVHFGFFPVPLALCGLALLRPIAAMRRRNARPLLVLIVGTFAVAFLFAALPFITGAALSTRWLMFSAWAIVVCGALPVQRLWHTGRAGRWMVAAMGLYIAWIAASMWLGALAWRIRPPEPF